MQSRLVQFCNNEWVEMLCIYSKNASIRSVSYNGVSIDHLSLLADKLDGCMRTPQKAYVGSASLDVDACLLFRMTLCHIVTIVITCAIEF
ncbi:hypothetical protein JRO89_XS01G0246500 [Xanthoceras sorbifolium]|uniref:Uncharacterized protein n=1 Tax=Xanthoceras sorbifolium TaxID=99658 RepID=A0ABQ8ILD6_9ROSI|nr:hypothetical protein JRO89_XS01G0246500 [Xanthoceras sorbifolium]